MSAEAKVDNVLVVGVGGQGVIMAAAIIADAALRAGLDVKLIETRGMSQRGGSVNSHIRIGARVLAPAISPGEVDYLLAFEAAEGLRLAPSLASGGVAIVNTQHIVPPLAASAEHSYPFDAVARMSAQGRIVLAVDGNAVAEQVGDQKVTGVVLVGALAARLSFADEVWHAAIAANVPPSWLELNLAAFAAGKKVAAPQAAATAEAAAAAPRGADEGGRS
jgi:indolepyruvate ferredoxin oxidoreductase, beta subunit